MTQLRYEDSAEQIKKGAPRYLRRAHAAGAKSVVLDDVIGEMNLAWTIAAQRYNPAHGVPFPAYLARGMQQHINRWIDEQIGHALGALDMDDHALGGEGTAIHEIIPDRAPRADELLEETHLWQRCLSELSEDAAQFVKLLRNPPPALYEEMHAIQARAEHARTRGIIATSPKSITGDLVLNLMGIERVDRNRIYAELRALGETMSRENTQ